MTIKLSKVKYEEILDKMVSSFLAWKLPENFVPDGGISFNKTFSIDHNVWPIGTNLFAADQAKDMFKECLKGAGIIMEENDSLWRKIARKLSLLFYL